MLRENTKRDQPTKDPGLFPHFLVTFQSQKLLLACLPLAVASHTTPHRRRLFPQLDLDTTHIAYPYPRPICNQVSRTSSPLVDFSFHKRVLSKLDLEASKLLASGLPTFYQIKSHRRPPNSLSTLQISHNPPPLSSSFSFTTTKLLSTQGQSSMALDNR